MALMSSLLEAVLTGWSQLLSAGAAASHQAKSAATACYTECWLYTLAKVLPLPFFKPSNPFLTGLREQINAPQNSLFPVRSCSHHHLLQ